jgi:hypothetical protein
VTILCLFALGSMKALMVMIMGRWSEGRSFTVLCVVDVASEKEPNEISGEELLYLAWCSTCVC